jgi:hypothetical protein
VHHIPPLLLAMALLAGCSFEDKDILAAQDKVRHELKDPDSAQFRNVVKYTNHYGQQVETVVCGEVNSKNTYGGYAGFTDFLVTPGGMVMLQVSGDTVFSAFRSDYCRDEFRKAGQAS